MAHSVTVRTEAIRLYGLGHSYNEISGLIGVSKPTLSLWLRHIELPSLVVYEKQLRFKDGDWTGLRAARLSKSVKLEQKYQTALGKGVEDANIADCNLAFFAGLYAGEGNKSGSFRFTNGDPELILFVKNILRDRYEVASDKFRVWIQYHDSAITYQNIQRYWAELLEIEERQFMKPTEKKSTNLSTKRPFGICALTVYDVFLRTSVMATANKLRQQRRS